MKIMKDKKISEEVKFICGVSYIWWHETYLPEFTLII